MHSITTSVAAFAAALSSVPLVSAHGYISGVVSGGKYYENTSPEWVYQSAKADTPGWYAYDQDNGYVAPTEYSDNNITCHKGATVGGTPIPMAAGNKIDLQWTTWPDSHHGPVITYMAAVDGEASSADKASLKWFKVAESGLVDGSASPGKWATDTLIANNNTANFTVPSSLKAGNYVVRNEIIALHSAGQKNGAQNYPQCINAKVTGSGTAAPTDGVLGTALYKSTDAGILVNIYQTLDSYKMPGPALWSGAASASASKLKRHFTA
ncbi:glycoside hydrolase family 61 [Lecanosticta acicola]|uniref:Glycoside hydrolase family 61 n=1 Tax=Lecanosticta acicola TaxID=111012 RepID=A0AAI9EDY9_9PEZI|nr:glycoside hydrolase family 61 [Lecanosticta acicola]